MEPHTYHVDLSWLEGRKGLLESDVLDEKIEVATPPEFAKGIAGIWSPEHLYVAAASSCFMTTFLAIAEKSRLEVARFKCPATGWLETVDGRMLITKILLKPTIVVAGKNDVAKGMNVLELAHRSCLVLNSMKTEITLKPNVSVTQEAEERL